MALHSSAKIIKDLRALGDPTFAKKMFNYSKTGVGEYAHGFQPLGIRMPVLRDHVKQSFAAVDLDVATELLHQEYHEGRAFSLLWMVTAYEKAVKRHDVAEQSKLFSVYCANFDYINNWDLVDVSAPKLPGQYLLHHMGAEESLTRMLRWCDKSQSLWSRRIAVLSTFPFLREQQFDPVVRTATQLLEQGEQEDLMHKASGWMLREVGKRDVGVLHDFLNLHAATMPRIMLRYSIEKLSTSERKHYLAMAKEKRTSSPGSDQGQVEEEETAKRKPRKKRKHKADG